MSLHIYKTPDDAAEGLALWIVGNINLVLRSRDRFSFVLSGGSTPKLLYQKMATQYADSAEWSRVDFFWGDERFVPYDDPRNNAKMAKELLLDPLGIKGEQVFPIPTGPTPAASASTYQHILEGYFHGEIFSFDFALLGMGTDAHTLSLFPGYELPQDSSLLVAHTFNEGDQLDRITLLPSIVNRAATIAFLVQGEEKTSILKKVLFEEHAPVQYPAQWIQPESGRLLWFVDEAALPV